MLDYNDLDPGIRNVVRWLNEQGFKTFDSGDGVTKDYGTPFPHASMEVEPSKLVEACDRLVAALEEAGVEVDPYDSEEDSVAVRGMHYPGIPRTLVLLSGLDDEGLAKAVSA